MEFMSRKMRELLCAHSDRLEEAQTLLAKEGVTEQEIEAKRTEIEQLNAEIEQQKAIDEEPFGSSGQALTNNLSKSKPEGVKNMENSIKFYTRDQAKSFVKDYTPQEETEQGLRMGAYLRGAITGNWTGAPKERAQFQSLNTAGGTVLIPQVLSAQILAQVMNKSMLYGTVPIVPMTSDNLTIAKVTSGPAVGFAAEGTLAPGMLFDSGIYSTANMAFEGVQLKSKTVRGIAKISNELLNSAQNLDQAVTDAFSSGLADAIDKAAVYGDGSNNTLTGIAHTEGVNIIAKGSDENYTPFVKAIGAIRSANGEPTTWGVNAAVDTSLNALVDTTKNPLKVPDVLAGLRRAISNNLRSNLAADGTTTGTGDKTFSESLVLDPSAMVFGQQMGISFAVTNTGLDALGTNSTYMAVTAYIDFAVLRPAFVSRIIGI